MKFLTNTFNPNHPYAKVYLVREEDETTEEAWEKQRRYLADKILGPPQATERYTVEELVAMNMIGVYEPELPDK